jgi:hypothetical protein
MQTPKSPIVPDRRMPAHIAAAYPDEQRPNKIDAAMREQLAAERMGITVARLREINAYAGKLRKKFPHMAPSRLQRKVCEYFKIKLVDNDTKADSTDDSSGVSQ